MLRALVGVNDNAYLQMYLYPKFLELAGQQRTPTGIVYAVRHILYTNAIVMPLELQKRIEESIEKDIPAFIAAIVPDPAHELVVQMINSDVATEVSELIDLYVRPPDE